MKQNYLQPEVTNRILIWWDGKKITVQNEKKRQKIEEEGINGREREI